MAKILKRIIDYYYYFYVIIGVIYFFGLPDLNSLLIVLTVGTLVVCVFSKHYRWNYLDIVICLYMAYLLSSCLFSNYRIELWYYGVKSQLMPMLFYFFGRSMVFSDNNMLKNMKWPMLFTFISGLFLFFVQPGWYMSIKMANLDFSNSNQYYEVTRLSSFWTWSYTMGYASIIFLMFYLKDFFKSKISLIDLSCLVSALLVLFFAQQRVSIAYFFVYLTLILLFSNVQHKNRIYKVFLFIAFLIGVLFFYLLNYADADYLVYLMSRSTELDENLIETRIKMFNSFWDVSLLGEGLGCYGHSALLYNLKCISDMEYIRLMAEQGVIGCLFFFVIIIGTLIRGFKTKKVFLFDFSIILFYLIAMTGATPLENNSMQPFLLWYCVGRINNRKLFNMLRFQKKLSLC